jgi:hypothetical protein
MKHRDRYSTLVVSPTLRNTNAHTEHHNIYGITSYQAQSSEHVRSVLVSFFSILPPDLHTRVNPYHVVLKPECYMFLFSSVTFSHSVKHFSRLIRLVVLLMLTCAMSDTIDKK